MMTKNDRDFQKWSHTWDSAFNLYKMGKISGQGLLEVTLMYKEEWNYVV